MRKRFIVCINKPNREEGESFTDYVSSIGLGWWNWIDGVWFLTDSKGKMTAKEIRDQAGKFFNNKRRFVVELHEDGDTWSGYGPKSENKNMFTWIRNNW